MASVTSGEILFPVFVSLVKKPRSERVQADIQAMVIDGFHSFMSELEECRWRDENNLTLNFRLADWDDFDQEEFERLMDELEEDLKVWEEN